MGLTHIEYARYSFSPWRGCSRVSPGCHDCFADRLMQRWGHDDLWRRLGPRQLASENYWKQPRRWNEEARQEEQRARILCGTLCDVFEAHPAVAEPRKRLFGVVEATPWLIWMFFTKRPENVACMVPWENAWPDNAWLISSVEDQRRADERIPLLLDSHAPVKGLSVEPLIAPVTLPFFAEYSNCDCGGHSPPCYTHEPHCGTEPGPAWGKLHWVIVGGESGSGKVRPMHPAWARSLLSQCQQANVPYWLKQWGEWGPAPWRIGPRPGETAREHKARAGAEGATHSYPAWAHEHHTQPIVAAHKPWSPARGELPPGLEPMRRWGKNRAGHLLDGKAWTQLPAAAYTVPQQ
jgi:protein gp37